MSRSRTAFLSGTITDNPLSAAATTINSAALANLPAIASPDIAVLVLDPAGSAGAPEVVYVTAHTGSATSATISRAQEGSSAREHASTIPWVHGPTTYDLKGWRLEAEDTAEYTTTSTTATDLVTISGLLIPVTQWVEVYFNFRRTAGAVAYGGIGLVVNATTICEANKIGTTNQLAFIPNTNAAGDWLATLTIAPRSTDYLNGVSGKAGSYTTYPTSDNPLPNATITAMTFRGIIESASVTIGIKNIQIMVRDS